MTEPDDADALRRAFAHAPPRPSGDPVDADALWEAVQGEAGPEAVAALADRMSHDADLGEDWRLAQAFARAAAEDEATADAREQDEGEPALPPSGVVAAQPANHGDYRWWGAVAVVVAAAVLLVVAWPRGGPSPYEPGDDGQMRGGMGAIHAVQGEGEVPRGEVVLEWSPVPEAVRYELVVSTPQLEPRLELTELELPRATVPARVLEGLPAGAELWWRVEAVRADDSRVPSETFVLTVR